MAWNELKKLKRDGKAAIAATVAGFLLAGTGLWTVAKSHEVVVSGLICVGMCVVLLGPVLGVAGASMYSLNRAGLVGAIMVGLPVVLLILLFWQEIHEGVWLLAASCSFGSVLAQVGALAGGSLAERNASPQRKQFTLGQMLVFFIPVAIFLGYVTHFPKR
jgi:hypothetical protein